MVFLTFSWLWCVCTFSVIMMLALAFPVMALDSYGSLGNDRSISRTVAVTCVKFSISSSRLVHSDVGTFTVFMIMSEVGMVSVAVLGPVSEPYL